MERVVSMTARIGRWVLRNSSYLPFITDLSELSPSSRPPTAVRKYKVVSELRAPVFPLCVGEDAA